MKFVTYSINQAIYLPNISQIIVISDSIHAAKRIFNFSLHSYQLYTSAISSELRNIFVRNCNMSSLQIVNLVSLYFIFHFYSLFILFS